jgi:thymidine phosphorylase
MDVKVGNGAFAASMDMATTLAESLVQVAQGVGLPTRSLITDMNQVLGWSAGNALEVREALDYLSGRAIEPRLHAVTLALGVQALLLGGLAASEAQAQEKLERALQSGRGLEHFLRMVCALGGPGDLLEHPDAYLPRAPVQQAVPAPRSGFVCAMDTRAIGLLVVELGGGRRVTSDTIDPRVGFSQFAPIGQQVQAGEPLALLHAATTADAQRASAALQALMHIGEAPAAPLSVICERPSL